VNKRRRTREKAEAATVATGRVPGTARAPAQGHSYYAQPHGQPTHHYQPQPAPPTTQMVSYPTSHGAQMISYQPPTGPYGPPPPPPPPGAYNFPIVATGLAQRRLPRELHVSETLPHIRLPIGTVDNGLTLLVLYDTGGGLSIGRRAYHEQIRQLRPDLVISFIDFATDPQSRYDPLTIGGIDGQVYGPSVTATITYQLPYIVNGQTCSITFGLADHAVANSLIGIPFMVLTGMVHAAKEKMVSSTVFAASYAYEHLQPVQTDAPHQLMENDNATVLVTPAQQVLVSRRGEIAPHGAGPRLSR
jgi:hypothetical protein